jgi:hypothetical protein
MSRIADSYVGRHLLVLLIVIGTLVFMFSRAPFGQDQAYHNFADQRGFLGIPNFGDVASNLAFLLAGLFGLKVCFSKHVGKMHAAWVVSFFGVALVGVTSSYYHWNPTDDTLVWDRMSLTIGFMGLFVAILGEYISLRLRVLLIPAVVLGASSVLYWHWFNDLRLYYWVQGAPLLIIPVVLLLFPAKYSHRSLLFAGILLYGVAKLAELGDKVVFGLTQGMISGHTIKHLVAGAACSVIALSLDKRAEIVSE